LVGQLTEVVNPCLVGGLNFLHLLLLQHLIRRNQQKRLQVIGKEKKKRSSRTRRCW
jgi:hypothetical protein